MSIRHKFLIGVDEAGRGPLAGPVSVGVVIIMTKNIPKLMRELQGVDDSKKLSEKKREEYFKKIKEAQKRRQLNFETSLVGEKIIDKKGIVFAVRLGIKRCFHKISCEPDHCRVLLDGTLYAPKKYHNQETIIKGDQKEFVIMLASIMAKVRRDKRMVCLAKKFPNYGFEQHKGYGTKKHYDCLNKKGFSPIHRRSFLRSLQVME